jgi:orotidine-5'-phosphate decarboxylase
MDLEKAKKVKDLVEKISKKEDLINYYKNFNFGLNPEIYKVTIEKTRKVIVDRLELEKKKLEEELNAI